MRMLMNHIFLLCYLIDNEKRKVRYLIKLFNKIEGKDDNNYKACE